MSRFAGILNVIVFVGLLSVLPLAVIPYGTVDAWWEAAVECLIFLLTALWTVEFLLGRGWHLRKLSVILPLAVITCYAFLQALPWPPASAMPHTLSIDRYQTYLTARKCLALTLFVAMLLSHITSTKRYRWTVRVVIAIGLGSALFAILRQFLQSADSPAGFVFPFLFYGLGYGQFMGSNLFAYLMEMSLGLSVGLVLGGGVGKKRALIYIAMVAVMWTALVLSSSRGGIMGLACESVFVFFFALKWYSEAQLSWGNEPNRIARFIGTSKPVQIVGIVVMIVALTSAVVWMGGDNLASKFAVNSDDVEVTTDGATRQDIWPASWRLFKNHPWTGTGFGAYYLGIPQFELSSGRRKLEQAHNDYLDLAASGGIVGLVLGGWLIFAAVRAAKSSFQQRDPYLRAGRLGAATGLIGVAVHSIVDFGLQVTGLAVVCAVLVALLLVEIAVTKKRSTREHSSRQRLRLTTH